jgi:hypothetical protein
MLPHYTFTSDSPCHLKGNNQPDRQTTALEDQDSKEKAKERVEQILTNWPFVCHNFYQS